MAVAVARQLAAKGNLEEGRRWLEVIADAATRAEVEQQLLKQPTRTIRQAIP